MRTRAWGIAAALLLAASIAAYLWIGQQGIKQYLSATVTSWRGGAAQGVDTRRLFSTWSDFCLSQGPTRDNAHLIASNMSLEPFTRDDLRAWQDRISVHEEQINKTLPAHSPRVALYLGNPEAWWLNASHTAALRYAIFISSMSAATQPQQNGHVSSSFSSCEIDGEANSYGRIAWMPEALGKSAQIMFATQGLKAYSFEYKLQASGVQVGATVEDLDLYSSNRLFGLDPRPNGKNVKSLRFYFDSPVHWSIGVTSPNVSD
jgi:hypothetical protein